jgi:hypothetical protein
MSEPMFGQCRCGGNLTVDHLRYHCSLRPHERRPLNTAALEEIISAVWPPNLRRGEGFAFFRWIYLWKPPIEVGPHTGPLRDWPLTLRQWTRLQLTGSI